MVTIIQRFIFARAHSCMIVFFYLSRRTACNLIVLTKKYCLIVVWEANWLEKYAQYEILC